MAEETGETAAQPQFDQAAIAAMIKESTREAFAEQSQRDPGRAVQTAPPPVQDNPFADFVNPIVGPRLQAANLRAEAAQDKVDFYTSEEWLTELDELLPGDAAEDMGKARKIIREKVEKTFDDMLRAGKGTYRRDILKFALGEYISENRASYTEGIVKKSSKKRELDLEKAKRAVDISTGIISNFTPADIHAMSEEKVLEQFGNLGF